MSIKLVAFDLDGTVLDSKKRVSPGNRRALEECAKRGIYVVPATGRNITGVPEEIRSIPGIRYAITINGGVLLDTKDSSVIDERRIDRDTALEVLDLVSGYHVMYDAYINGTGISESRFYDHLDEYHVPKEIQKLVRLTRTVVLDIKDYVRECPFPVEKINLMFDDLSVREEVRRLVSARDDVIVSSSMGNNLEINAVGATKGEGLERLAAHLGLSLQETMAFGDGENDFNMIRMAGIGVAMENGEDRLKQMADFVTASNDKDGVARALERFVLC